MSGSPCATPSTPRAAILPVTNALVVPLMQDEAEVGVLEAINREGRPFDEDDEFFLIVNGRDGQQRAQECQPDACRAQARDS